MPRSSKPPDVEAATADRVCAHRDRHIERVREVLRDLAVYVPSLLLEDALREIKQSANRMAWGCEREGEHHAGLRRTVRRTPPDPDRAPGVSSAATTRRRR